MGAADGGSARIPARVRPADPYARALALGRGPLFLRGGDGRVLRWNVEHWCARPDRADATVLHRCEDAVLDVGCGPGRMVADLAERGRRVLGVDEHPAAVARARAAGARALCASVFSPLPGEGCWPTALLLDGNIGIGGAPEKLLARLADVVAPHGLLLVEAAGEDVDERMGARLCDGLGRCGAPFAWARVGLPALAEITLSTQWTLAESWSWGHRPFAALRRAGERE